ncbi:MAG: glycerol-3-phosphate dehydrogenase [Desulfobacca sp.]|nr:glycerol-3-phosphate dehydrogenase [Desulfobacca sp.]
MVEIFLTFLLISKSQFIMEDNPSFAATNREWFLRKMTSQKFEVLIIGGGITGAGVALDAASRGLSVALVEKDDFASGTSSRSTKLIHGGLRYLEHLEFNLVKQIGRERQIVHRNAPHIVIPERMMLPIIKDGNLGEFTTSIALHLYDYLAQVKKTEKMKMLSYGEMIALETLLESEILKGGAVYTEYKTDDARLTLEVLKKTFEYGALLLNYSEVTEFIYDQGKIRGVELRDNISKRSFQIFADTIINATGCWVDRLRSKDNSLKEKRLHITKGIHLVVSREKLDIQHALYFDVGDKRMIFAIPRDQIVYIGTTDTDYTDNYDLPRADLNDVNYLLKAINRLMPKAKLAIDDVQSTWAGLRPLIHQEGKEPSELSRKEEIFFSPTGLISIAGGKLTGYRLMAKNLVNLLAKKMAKNQNKILPSCTTHRIQLAGGEFDFEPSSANLLDFAQRKYEEAKPTGISSEEFKKLFYRYGKNINWLTEKAFDYYTQTKITKEAWLRSEVWYAVHFEMAHCLTDFFIRRTGMIFFFINEIETCLPIVADEFARQLKLDRDQIFIQIEALNKHIEMAKLKKPAV